MMVNKNKRVLTSQRIYNVGENNAHAPAIPPHAEPRNSIVEYMDLEDPGVERREQMAQKFRRNLYAKVLVGLTIAAVGVFAAHYAWTKKTIYNVPGLPSSQGLTMTWESHNVMWKCTTESATSGSSDKWELRLKKNDGHWILTRVTTQFTKAYEACSNPSYYTVEWGDITPETIYRVPGIGELTMTWDNDKWKGTSQDGDKWELKGVVPAPTYLLTNLTKQKSYKTKSGNPFKSGWCECELINDEPPHSTKKGCEKWGTVVWVPNKVRRRLIARLSSPRLIERLSSPRVPGQQ